MAVLATLGPLLGFLGCGSGGPVTYPVRGKVELAGGDGRQLAGSHVEAALASGRETAQTILAAER